MTTQAFWGGMPSFDPSRIDEEEGGGYPPIPGFDDDDDQPIPELAPPLTLEQVQDMAQACERANTLAFAGEVGIGPLAQPFVYTGIDFEGMRSGDKVSHMVASYGGECITNAEAERHCASNPGLAVCKDLPGKIPMWAYYAAGGAAALALVWYATR